MRNSMKLLAASTLIIAGLAAAPSLYAHEAGGSGGSTMGSTTGSGMMGMMGQDGGMPMMEQMAEMMKNCNAMMQAKADKPALPEGETVPDPTPSPKG